MYYLGIYLDNTRIVHTFHQSLYVSAQEVEVSCPTEREYNGDLMKMTSNPRPSSTLQKNAEVLHVLYGLLDSDRDPTDADAESLRYLYASS
jgi:hypothetical protein